MEEHKVISASKDIDIRPELLEVARKIEEILMIGDKELMLAMAAKLSILQGYASDMLEVMCATKN